MKKSYSLAVLLIVWLGLHAQNPFQSYELRASGVIPEDFTMDPQTRIENARKKLSEKEKKDKARLEFLTEQSYYLKRVFQGGKVLFGDPATEYVNKIGQKLLANDEKLAGKIRFYVVKTPEVNASAFDDGVILVNAGLIAQVRNEAELAFVLAHEITHILQRHGIEGYSQRAKVAKTRQDLESRERKFAIFYYSKELETEADKLGFANYFLNSGYDVRAAYTAFDVLEYSHLPLDEIAVDPNLFETEYFKLPKGYFLEKLSPISGGERDDEESTHPNLTKRREIMEELIKSAELSGGSLYLVGEAEFKKVQALCKNEVIKQQVIQGDITDALYNCYVILKRDPDNAYARYMMAYCYYALARCKVEKKFDKITRSYKKVEGESQQLHYILSKLTRDELMTLSIHQIYKLGGIRDTFYNTLIAEILKDMVKVGKFRTSDFSRVPPGVVDSTAIILEDTLSEGSSKYSKIKRKQTKDTTQLMLRFALIDEMNDTLFVSLFRKAVLQMDLYQKDKYDALIAEDDEEETSTRKGKKRSVITEGETQEVERLVWVDPYYYEFDNRRDEVKRVNNYKREQEFFTDLESLAKEQRIKLNIVHISKITSDDVDAYNTRVMFNEWYEEKSHLKFLPLVSSRTFDMQDVADYYHTDYIAWGGVISVRTKSYFAAGCAGAVCTSPVLVAIPYAIYHMFLPRREATAGLSIFGVKQNKMIYRSEREFAGSHSRVSLLNFYYREFKKIKTDASN